jgi:hypothetical protein
MKIHPLIRITFHYPRKVCCATDYTVMVSDTLRPRQLMGPSFPYAESDSVEKVVRRGGIKPPTKDKELTHPLC